MAGFAIPSTFSSVYVTVSTSRRRAALPRGREVIKVGAADVSRAQHFDLSITLELVGKMRSTPWLKLILRTVKLGWLPPLLEITTPSNACKRYLVAFLDLYMDPDRVARFEAGISVRRSWRAGQ